MKIMVLRSSQIALVCLCLSLLSEVNMVTAQPQPTTVANYPASMAATGDSITRAFDVNSNAVLADAPAYSWSTGDNATINSQYERILAASPVISGANYNDAVSGAKMSDLAGQMNTVNSQHVNYVTVLMGGNDICTSSETNMTDVASYQQQFQTALTTLTTGSPDARIFVASIPNIYNLWQVLHTDPNAVSIWNNYGICQSMLANPTSTADADNTRRNNVLEREVAFNTALAQICAQFIHCRFDNNAVFNTAYQADDASPVDYYHPSESGQTKLAAGTWTATFDFTDGSAPSSVNTVTAASIPNQLNISLSAADNVGVNGIEYKLDSGSWTKYTASQPLTLTASNVSLTYRAVDINGNNEPMHTIWVVGTNQDFSTTLTKAQPGDTIAFTGSGTQTLTTSTTTIPAKVKVVGAGCGSAASIIHYGGTGNTGTVTLSGGDSLSSLKFTGFHLVANAANGNGDNHLACVRVSATNP